MSTETDAGYPPDILQDAAADSPALYRRTGRQDWRAVDYLQRVPDVREKEAKTFFAEAKVQSRT